MSTKAFEEAHETVCDKAVLDLLAAQKLSKELKMP